jgi:hypothetical protein
MEGDKKLKGKEAKHDKKQEKQKKIENDSTKEGDRLQRKLEKKKTEPAQSKPDASEIKKPKKMMFYITTYDENIVI